ncbi:MAG TPA: sulfite exporter TauE/SafE family protein [Usitatibacter sp.]|nr:sulfite exporter TauE/SafE family protein [Usitatibacter sp.]
MTELLAYLAIGGATGFFAGLLGIGGGTIIVSSLALMFAAQGFPQPYVMHMSIGTSLAAIMAGAWASFRTHHRHGSVDWPAMRAMVPGTLVGVALGAVLARFMNTAALKASFLAIMTVIIVQLIFNLRPKATRPLPGVAGMTAAGIVTGVSSSLFGGGAAAVGVPFLTWCSMTIHRAIGTVAALGFPVAIAGAIAYAIAGMNAPGLPPWSVGFVYLPAFAGISVMSVLVAPYGARLAHKLKGPTLRRIFAVFLIGVGAKVAISV